MKPLGLLLVIALAVSACADDEGGTVQVLAHDFFVITDELADQFTAETGYEIEVIHGGDAGLVVNQAVLSAGNPVADVVFGVDTTLLSRAVDGDAFLPYRSPRLDEVPRHLHVDRNMATPIDLGDVCLNYDLGGIETPPESLRDLVDPAYAGTLVVPDPTISSPGLAFVLATIAEFGETGSYTWLDFWAELRANDVMVVSDWGTAYYGTFSGTGGGDRPIVVSYASSPPAEVMFADPPIESASTAIISAGCFRQVEYAGVLRGADNPQGAMEFIDFMLGLPFQESVPETMFVFPVRPDADLPDVFLANTTIPEAPATLEPSRIEEHRDRWLREWSDVVLR